MNQGLKYLIIMKDSRGKDCLVRVKASNAKEASILASEKWPKYTVRSVKTHVYL